MAATMQFDLVAPERRLASMQASEVLIPGSEGNLTAMPGHAPVIVTLRPGILRVVGAEGTQEYTVTGGFAEVSGDAVTVLAERSHPVSEMTQAILNEMIAEARARYDYVKTVNEPGPVDDMVRLLADMVAMGTHIGLDPHQPNVLP